MPVQSLRIGAALSLADSGVLATGCHRGISKDITVKNLNKYTNKKGRRQDRRQRRHYWRQQLETSCHLGRHSPDIQRKLLVIIIIGSNSSDGGTRKKFGHRMYSDDDDEDGSKRSTGDALAGWCLRWCRVVVSGYSTTRTATIYLQQSDKRSGTG